MLVLVLVSVVNAKFGPLEGTVVTWVGKWILFPSAILLVAATPFGFLCLFVTLQVKHLVLGNESLRRWAQIFFSTNSGKIYLFFVWKELHGDLRSFLREGNNNPKLKGKG